MRRLTFEFNTRLEFSSTVTRHDYLLRCLPWQAPEQIVCNLSFYIRPEKGTGVFDVDGFGNRIFCGRIKDQHTFFEYGISGDVIRNDNERKHESVMGYYSFPSALTRPIEKIKQYIANFDFFGNSYEKALKLNEIVHNYFDYVPGSTNIATSAAEAFNQKKGVCQDFAHVFIVMARLLGIPARYVCGLPYGEGVSHAWAEIWQDGIWHGFDPTRLQIADEGYIKLCVGRDYQDCPLERGLFLGNVSQVQNIYMQVRNK